VDTQDLIKQLNLQQAYADPTKYLVWQIPTSVDILNTFVTQANVQTTQLFGNLTQSSLYGLAQQYAIWRAVLNLIETMTVNWVISGLPVTVGDISINRLQAMIPASAEIKENALREIHRLYILLSEFSFPQNYQPSSLYIYTGGQTWFS
jgi:hypothetical protein